MESGSAEISKFRSKAIVTTSTKAKIVENLKNYWQVKSIMMQIRANPELLKDPTFQLQTMRYVQENTELATMAFWKKLTPEAQMKACQYLVMHEMKETNYFRIDPSQDKAAIYVILSGSAEVKEGLDSHESVFTVGDIFGATEMFEEATKNPNAFDFNNLPEKLTTMNNSKQATLHKGTYMRLSLFDFHEHVLKNPAEEEEKMREEAAKISGIRWEDLTEDDKFYVRVYKRTRQLINSDLFAFLDSYKLIPKNARTPAYRYYREGVFGRELHLDPEEALSVYIIIDGGIRLDIEAKREDDPDHNIHTLSCKRKGKKPMVIRTRTMPILLIESGSLLFPATECHTVGSQDEYGLGYRVPSGADDDTTSIGDMSMSTLPSVSTVHHFPPSGHPKHHSHSSPPRSGHGHSLSVNVSGASAVAPSPTAAALAAANQAAATFYNNLSNNNNNPNNAQHQFASFSFMAQPHMTSQGHVLPGHSHLHHHPGGGDNHSVGGHTVQSKASIISKYSDDYNTFVAMYAHKFHHTVQKIPKKMGNNTTNNNSKKPVPGLYRLRAVFERETTYLKIPFAHFAKILDDNRLIVQSMADAIKRQLQRSNDAIVKRITSLLPWLHGKLSLRPSSALGTVDEDEVNVPTNEGEAGKAKRISIGGDLMGSYGTNILSSSLDTMMGKNMHTLPLAGGIAAAAASSGMRRHASATSMGVTTTAAESRGGGRMSTSRTSGSGSAGGGRRGGGGEGRTGTHHSNSSSQSKAKILKSLKDQLATKQCPPVFLTASSSSSSKGQKGHHSSHHRKKRVKRSASKDDSSSVASEGGDTGGVDRSMTGTNDETGEDGIVPDLLSSMAALSTAHLPPLETVSEV